MHGCHADYLPFSDFFYYFCSPFKWLEIWLNNFTGIAYTYYI